MENQTLILDTNQAENNLLLLRELGPFNQCITVGLDPSNKFLMLASWFVDISAVKQKSFPSYLDRCIIMKDKRIPWSIDQETGRIFDTLYAVSNGKQTLSVLNYESLERAMLEWDYKNDSPRFTARITALCTLFHRLYDPLKIEMSVIKKAPDSNNCIRDFYFPTLLPSFGVCLTTHIHQDKTFPIQEGKPFVIPIYEEGNQVNDIAQIIWDSLGEGRVYMAVSCVGLRNREFFFKVMINPLFESQVITNGYPKNQRGENSFV